MKLCCGFFNQCRRFGTHCCVQLDAWVWQDCLGSSGLFAGTLTSLPFVLICWLTVQVKFCLHNFKFWFLKHMLVMLRLQKLRLILRCPPGKTFSMSLAMRGLWIVTSTTTIWKNLVLLGTVQALLVWGKQWSVQNNDTVSPTDFFEPVTAPQKTKKHVLTWGDDTYFIRPKATQAWVMTVACALHKLVVKLVVKLEACLAD